MTRRVLVSTLAPLGLLALHGACGDPSHVYEGRLFVEERHCLGTKSSVDVVDGERPGSCGPTCLAQPTADRGRAIYVGTMCGPYPYGFETSGADPRCPAALAALERNDTCLIDGGSTRPALPDAGSD